MKNRVLTTAMLLAFSGAALAAPGQKQMGSKAPSFDELDKNDNGSISRSEARAYPKLEKIFSDVDADKNGKLLSGEFRNATRKLQS